MKRIDIDRIFANLLGEYIADGYVINTNTMGGHQGEVAKVDLRKGDEFLRMSLEKGRDYRRWCPWSGWYALTIGRANVGVRNDDNAIVWTDSLEEVDRHVFWQLGENWFTGLENYAEKCRDKAEARSYARWQNVDPLVSHEMELPVASHKVVLDRVRKLPKCKSVKLSDIEKVKKVRRGDSNEWVVVVRDHRYTIGSVKIA